MKPIYFLFNWKSDIDEKGLHKGLRNRPTTQAIDKIVKKFEETGVVTNIERPVHHRFACSAENIVIVSESVAKDQNVSISRRGHYIQKKSLFGALFSLKLW